MYRNPPPNSISHVGKEISALKQSKNRRSEEGMETGQMNRIIKERGLIDMRTRLRSKVTLLFMTCAVLLAVPAMALAAELVTSELDTVTPNAVTVEQGGTTNTSTLG
jgi:hypothetical protein